LKPVLFLLSGAATAPIFKLEDGKPPKLFRFSGRELKGIASNELPPIALTRGVNPPNGFLGPTPPPPPPPPPVNENDNDDDDNNEEGVLDAVVNENDDDDDCINDVVRIPAVVEEEAIGVGVSTSAPRKRAFAFSMASEETATVLFRPVVKPVNILLDPLDAAAVAPEELEPVFGTVEEDSNIFGLLVKGAYVEDVAGVFEPKGIIEGVGVGTGTESARSNIFFAFSSAEAEIAIGRFRPVENPSNVEVAITVGIDRLG